MKSISDRWFKAMTGQVLFLFAVLVLFALGCSDNDSSDSAEKETLTATITRTSYGVPHIKAENLKSLTFGQGYAFAEDGLCILADQIVKIRSERSLYFGPGDNDENIISDLGYKALNVYDYAEDGYDTLPQDIQDIITGYVAGYNKYLADTGLGGLSPECRNTEWVKPIDEIDLLAYYISIALLASGENFIDYIAEAGPPEATSQQMIQQIQEMPEIDLPDFRDLGIGSNGWGIGKDLTENGKGALLANPHFPATGPLKFWESHLTIPGELNISGTTLYGAPLVLIGFNENLGWTHTVADSVHFSVYKLKLVDGDPTSYHYDGQTVKMTSQVSEIKVLQEDGTLQTVSQTHYRSHYGVMVNAPKFLLGWTDSTAYTLKDANENDIELLSHWLAMNRAGTLEEFQDAFRNFKGIPWVNAIYADDQGNAFYIDGTPVPNLSQEVLDEFQDKLENDLFTSLLYDNGIVLLDGEDPKNEWQGDLRNGLVPYEDAPKLTRTDFTSNSNDSHWLTNPDEPLEGYSMLYGPEKTERSLRTRMGFILLEDSAGDDGLWSAVDIEKALLSNRGMLSELILDDLIDRCQSQGDTGVVLESGESVDISGACGALAAWDGLVNPDSKGAHVFREFGSHFTEDLFATPFDVNQPIDTPNGLAAAPATGEDPVLQCLALAAKDLETAGIPMDAELGDIHFIIKNDEKIPYHGGIGSIGVFNMVKYSNSTRYNDRTLLPEEEPGTIINSATGLYDEGYLVNYGTSTAFALEFTDDGPKAQGILTYSQSNNPESPHFDDQTRLFSQKQFRPMLFTDEEIAADKQSEATISVEVDQ